MRLTVVLIVVFGMVGFTLCHADDINGIVAFYVVDFPQDDQSQPGYDPDIPDLQYADNFYANISYTLQNEDPNYFHKAHYWDDYMHAAVMLESWRDWWYSGGSHTSGPDINDDEGTVTIIASHGNIEQGAGDLWHFRFRNPLGDRTVDNITNTSTNPRKCKNWFRNPIYSTDWPLIRMGSSSSSSSIGDGDTRWVIFYACHSLQLAVDPADDLDYTLQDVWGHDSLNGGYRMLIGGSSTMRPTAYAGADDFVDLQYTNDLRHKAAWFIAMDGYFYANAEDQLWGDEGRCVVYAKGGSLATAQLNREYDSFWRFGDSAVPATSDQPNGWYSSWSTQYCDND